MTQADSHTPSAGEQPEYREEFQVMGEQLVTTVEQLIHEGNVRRIIIKQEGHTMLEIPLTIGVVGVLVAPLLAAVGAIGAAVTNCTIEVVRTAPQRTGEPPPAHHGHDGWRRDFPPPLRPIYLGGKRHSGREKCA